MLSILIKRATRFTAFLQNELKSDVARFTTHIQTCLATNQVVAGCENLLQKVESSSTFWNKTYTCCAFYRPRTNLSCSKWRNSCVWRDFYPIRSQYSRKLQQPLFVARQVWMWVVKRATSLFNSFCSNVAKQVARFCRPFYRTLDVYMSSPRQYYKS